MPRVPEGCTEFRVCQGGDCSGRGSALLLRDLEELCSTVGASGDTAYAQPWTCFGKCGEGPNVEIASGRDVKLRKGIRTYQRAASLVEDHVGEPIIGNLVRQVTKLKYEARREESAGQRLLKVEEAISLLGSDAQEKFPRLFSDLLLLRARDLVRCQKADALADAGKAVALAPHRAWAHAVLGSVQEVAGQLPEAHLSLKRSIELERGVDVSSVRKQLKRVERKLTQTEPSKDSSWSLPADPPKGVYSGGTDSPTFLPSSDGSTAKSVDFATWVVEELDFRESSCGYHGAWDAPAEVAGSLHIKLKAADPLVALAQSQDVGPIWHVDVQAPVISSSPRKGKSSFSNSRADEDERFSRPYTPITSLQEFSLGKMHLLIKVYTRGRMTQRLAKLKPGATLTISKPRQTAEPELLDYVEVMVAGGTAATVALQVCSAALRSRTRQMPIHLVLCNRTVDDIWLRERFDGMQLVCPSFRVVHCISRGLLPKDATKDEWIGGVISPKVFVGTADAMSRSAESEERPAQRLAMVSGPPGFCHAAKEALLSSRLGLTRDDIRFLDAVYPDSRKFVAGSGGPMEAENCSETSYRDAGPMIQDNTSESSTWSFQGFIWDVMSCKRRCRGGRCGYKQEVPENGAHHFEGKLKSQWRIPLEDPFVASSRDGTVSVAVEVGVGA